MLDQYAHALWLQRDYYAEVNTLSKTLDLEPEQVTAKFGELVVDYYDESREYVYDEQLGLMKNLNNIAIYCKAYSAISVFMGTNKRIGLSVNGLNRSKC